MDKKQRRKLRRMYIRKGIKNALICDAIAVVVLTVIAALYALIRKAPLASSIYMSFYYGGGFGLLLAVPQLYKRNEDTKLRKIRRSSPFYGFYDWFGGSYTDEAMAESYEEFKGDGFWLGMMMIFFSIVLIALAVILENLFFVK